MKYDPHFDAVVDYKEILTVKEAASYLQLHKVTVYRFLKQKKLHAARIGGRWRFKKQELNKWMDDCIYGYRAGNKENPDAGNNTSGQS